MQDETRKRIFEVAEQLDYQVKDKKKRKRKLKIGVLYSYSLEEELEDTYYLSVRVAIEKKLAEEMQSAGENTTPDREQAGEETKKDGSRTMDASDEEGRLS